MFIPKRVVNFAKKLEENRLKKAEAKKRAEVIKAEEKRKLDQEREDRASELLDALAIIFSWLDEFTKSEVCLNILKNKYRVLLFLAKYWLGKPCAEDSVGTYATIEYRYDKHIYYCEYHKGRERVSKDLLILNNFFGGFNSIQHCIVNLHPDFIVEWAEEIQNGKVWERVLRS